MSHPATALLVELIEQAFDQPAWHGPNLRNALRGVGAELAGWRPQSQRHSIWEIAVHCAYWKYRVVRPLTDEPPRAFELKGSDWFERPPADAEPADAWRRDLALLDAWQVRLLGAVASFDPARLDEVAGRGRFSYRRLVMGAASHDLYHAGQIRLLRRLAEGAGAP